MIVDDLSIIEDPYGDIADTDEQEFYIMNETYAEDPELAGFFGRVWGGVKKAVTPPARIRSAISKKVRKIGGRLGKAFTPGRRVKGFLKKAGKGIKSAVKSAMPLLKIAGPLAMNALIPGSGVVVGGAMKAFGGLSGAVGSASKIIQGMSGDTSNMLNMALNVAGSALPGGGSGMFKNNTDIINKIIAWKSGTKKETPVAEAIGNGKALGFTPGQIADLITKQKLKVGNKVFNAQLFPFGDKPNYFVGLPKRDRATMDRMAPVIRTKTGLTQVYKLFEPGYFHLGSDENIDLNLKFLTGLIEGAKAVVGKVGETAGAVYEKGKEIVTGTAEKVGERAGTVYEAGKEKVAGVVEAVKETAGKIFPSKEEREEAQRQELLEKKVLLLKNINTLENSLRNIKSEYNIKQKIMPIEDREQILKDVHFVTAELAKMKDELEKLSNVDLEMEVNLGFPILAIAITGAVALLGYKIADTVKMHKMLARDKLILSKVEGAITSAQAAAMIGRPVVTTQKKKEVRKRFEIPGLLPIAIIALGGGLLLYMSKKKGQRRRRRWQYYD